MSDAGRERDTSTEGGPPAGLNDRRRLIQRSIRQRTDPPRGLEDLAMQVALRQSGLRWFVVLYAVGVVVEVADFALTDSAGTRIRDGVLALLFLLGGFLQWRSGTRARDAVDRWSRRATSTQPTDRTEPPAAS